MKTENTVLKGLAKFLVKIVFCIWGKCNNGILDKVLCLSLGLNGARIMKIVLYPFNTKEMQSLGIIISRATKVKKNYL